VDRDTDRLALFPLANVVLFPRVQTPLHLFEPRYRQMAEHVLAGGRTLGMVTVPPEHAAAMKGDPPVYAVGCAGVITQSQRQPDGRYNIVLEGTHRFRIEHEIERTEGRLYRVAAVEWLEDVFDPADAERIAELRAHLIRLVSDFAKHSRAAKGVEISESLFEELDDVTFVNSLSNAFAFAPEEKQGLLETDDVARRFERLEALLSFRLAEITTPGAPRSDVLH
jgi:Lon protease-like protein